MSGYKQTSLFPPTAGGPSSLRPHRGQWVKGDDGSDSSSGMPKYNLLRGTSKSGNVSLPFKRPTPAASDCTDDDDAYEHANDEEEIPSSQIPQSARPPPSKFPRRTDTPATITIGDRSPVTTRETPRKKRRIEADCDGPALAPSGFCSALSKFLAPGTQVSPRADTDSISVKKPLKKVQQTKSILGKTAREGEIADDEPELGEDELASPGEGTDTVPRGFPNGEPSPSLLPPGSAPDRPPLFLSRHGPDPDEQEEEAASGEQVKEAEMSVPPEVEKEDDDDEYVPEREASLRAAARAARLLKEAEARETTLPVAELLVRNINIFKNCRRVSTVGMVKFQQTSLDQIREAAKRLRSTPPPPSGTPRSSGKEAGLDAEEDSTAEQRLTLTVTKADFLNMRILGQFNKGFILTSRDNELFIIDQHASDEKYNFETLQATTVVQNQPLVIARNLELMAMDEIAVQDNLDVLRGNGFVVEVDPEMPTGRRCKLVSLPMSRETIFGVEGVPFPLFPLSTLQLTSPVDLEELIHLIHQHRGSGTAHLRCSKVRSMFAMRACRKSVMVGRALPVNAMEKIVRHMGELDKPWNCPHGRPTMRHLMKLEGLDTWSETTDLKGGGGGLQWDGNWWMEQVEKYGPKQEGEGEGQEEEWEEQEEEEEEEEGEEEEEEEGEQ